MPRGRAAGRDEDNFLVIYHAVLVNDISISAQLLIIIPKWDEVLALFRSLHWPQRFLLSTFRFGFVCFDQGTRISKF